ncbi:MAG TPA: hypothetical protein DDX85_09650 [Nitrospiraceae bacterium]|nr:hypothetical protein [Nitrospiraceae bacterium]
MKNYEEGALPLQQSCEVSRRQRCYVTITCFNSVIPAVLEPESSSLSKAPGFPLKRTGKKQTIQ